MQPYGVRQVPGSAFDFTYFLGTYRDQQYHIGCRLDPNPNSVESYAIFLFFELVDGTVVEVALADNTEHEEGTHHVDRYYRAPGATVKDFDVEFETWYDAETYLVENWLRFARQYYGTYGNRPRTD